MENLQRKISISIWKAILSFINVFLFIIAIVPLYFYWIGTISVAVGVIYYFFGKDNVWRQHGLILSSTVGFTSLAVKIFNVMAIWFGLGILISYCSLYLILFIVNTTHKGRNPSWMDRLLNLEYINRIKANRKFYTIYLIIMVVLASFFFIPSTIGSRKVPLSQETRYWEYLDRGLVAMRTETNDVYIGWRLLQQDPETISFNIYRANATGPHIKLNIEPINETTNFLDDNPVFESETVYYIRPIIDEVELAASKNVTIMNQAGNPYISIPLNGAYGFNKIAIADLNGDGAYDYVIKQPDDSIDPFGPPAGNWEPSQDTYKIEAYLSNGTFLWRKDLGWDIEKGIWYSPYIVYDVTGDNRAEVIIKTGEGDHRDHTGRVRYGREFLSLWDGMTGQELVKTTWPRRMPQIYNWNSRNQLGIAYLDGKNPTIMAARGTYWMMKLQAFNFDGNSIYSVWKWENTHESGFNYLGSGAHYMHSADVDSDGKDEVILGTSVINEDGTGLWALGYEHTDHCYVGDIDPERPGLEIYNGIEGIINTAPKNGYGINLVKAESGELLWQVDETTYHIHSTGLVSDIDPNYPGMECYSGEQDYDKRWLHAANGTLIASEAGFNKGLRPRAVYWDADMQREIIYNQEIFDYESEHIHLSDLQGSQVAWADILGDWREEIIISVEGELRIYTTTIPALNRYTCLMQDPIYRTDVAHISMGYEQCPMTSFCLSSL
ncbi:MAG: silent information regulator protein Sir2 [Candidatus Lokiarchaeota archaeon]|nr:silent information regulator protein Sir2 [Candidatus Lokiarchaeota archaeon]